MWCKSSSRRIMITGTITITRIQKDHRTCNIMRWIIITCIPRLAAAVRLSPRLTCSRSSSKPWWHQWSRWWWQVWWWWWHARSTTHQRVLGWYNREEKTTLIIRRLNPAQNPLKHLLVSRFYGCQDRKLLPHVTKQFVSNGIGILSTKFYYETSNIWINYSLILFVTLARVGSVGCAGLSQLEAQKLRDHAGPDQCHSITKLFRFLKQITSAK